MIATLVSRFLLFIIFMGIMLFVPAGTPNYPEAWIYMSILILPMTFTTVYFLKNDPELLRRRLQKKEKVKEQKTIVRFMNLIFVSGFIIPGLDHRFGWSEVPFFLVIISCLIILGGYFFLFNVFKANSYASRIIEVEKGQKVITTGPYAIVRHPMYTAMLIMFLFTPLALGSYWALIPMLCLPIILIVRLLNEEKMLKQELDGYQKYCENLKYRLIPWIW